MIADATKCRRTMSAVTGRGSASEFGDAAKFTKNRDDKAGFVALTFPYKHGRSHAIRHRRGRSLTGRRPDEISFRPICFGTRKRGARKGSDRKVGLKARTSCVGDCF